LGLKLFLFIQKLAVKVRRYKLEKTLDEYDLRTLGKRTDGGLYDEIISVPLLLVGGPIKGDQIISQQVCSIDVFPTILDLVNKTLEDKIDGQTLFPQLQGMSFDVSPVYIESTSIIPNTPGLMIGVRTSEYKYFRSRNRQNSNMFLFDLKHDPLEKINIASTSPDIVQSMEKILQSLFAKSSQQTKYSLKKIIAKKKANLSLQE
jgi:arylsulfatase A-like enzyme